MNVHDITPDFIAFYDEVEGEPDATRLERFWSDLHPANPAFYDQRLAQWERFGKDVEVQLLEEIAAFGTYQDAFVQLQSAVPEMLRNAVASFKRAFPDFDDGFDVHLLHSLKSMDGGTRELDGEHAFIFGLDMMARFHPWDDERAFFHHELLHAYIKQLHVPNMDWYSSDELLLKIWEEGLAVHVSHLLNPEATYNELALDFPEGLFERAWRDRTFLARDLLDHLNSTDEAVYRRYFLPWAEDKRVPDRAGYVIGYVVVRELAKQHSLAALLKPASKEELKKLVEGQLPKLAKLPDDAYLPGPPRPMQEL